MKNKTILDDRELLPPIRILVLNLLSKLFSTKTQIGFHC
jgi:hypothetical protein